MCSPRSTCRSIGLVSVTNIDGTLKPFPCNSCNSTLTESQYTLCSDNPYILSAVVRGVKRALSACNTLFGDDKCVNDTCWNCTIYIGHFLLGEAVEATRECPH